MVFSFYFLEKGKMFLFLESVLNKFYEWTYNLPLPFAIFYIVISIAIYVGLVMVVAAVFKKKNDGRPFPAEGYLFLGLLPLVVIYFLTLKFSF